MNITEAMTASRRKADRLYYALSIPVVALGLVVAFAALFQD